MKKLHIHIAAMLALMFAASLSIASGEIRWLSLRDGEEKARAEKKPMIVDFYYGKGCPRCEALQKNVYDDPSIAGNIQRNFIPIRIDLTKKLTKEEIKLGERYDYKDDCLLLFLDHTGRILSDSKGKRLCFVNTVDPEWFAGYLDMIKAASGR
jgi:thioredoxin-related protein